MPGPVKVIEPRRFEDHRGWFSETYVLRRWREAGVGADFVQDNHSLSHQTGTVRGIHFQRPPHSQAKLVRCTAGRIMDYVVDLRNGSPTYGQALSIELSAANLRQLYIPVGFGHAFITLEADCEVMYKVDEYYSPECDGGIRWDCPDVGIEWPLPGVDPIASDKDVALPFLSDFLSPFAYDGEPMTTFD